MSKPIAVGDLVQVVRTHPCQCPTPDKTFGIIFVVALMGQNPHGSKCGACGKSLTNTPYRFVLDSNGKIRALDRLKRIPPLAELESTRTEEKTREPA